MSLEENKAIVRRYYEDAPYHPEACDEIFAPRVLFHTIQRANLTAQDQVSNPECEKVAYGRLIETWGQWGMTIDEMMAEGDRVMVRWTHSGIHQGEISGLPPTYRPVTFSGINIFRVAEGKITEVWDLFDRLGLWQQLGVLPDLKDAIAKAREAALPG